MHFSTIKGKIIYDTHTNITHVWACIQHIDRYISYIYISGERNYSSWTVIHLLPLGSTPKEAKKRWVSQDSLHVNQISGKTY